MTAKFSLTVSVSVRCEFSTYMAAEIFPIHIDPIGVKSWDVGSLVARVECVTEDLEKVEDACHAAERDALALDALESAFRVSIFLDNATLAFDDQEDARHTLGTTPAEVRTALYRLAESGVIPGVFVCECANPGHRNLFWVTDHEGRVTTALYCRDCAELARMDWNGETAKIERV
jgi:hypothetical protein